MKTLEAVNQEITQILNNEAFGPVIAGFIEKVGPEFGVRVQEYGMLSVYKKNSPSWAIEVACLTIQNGELCIIPASRIFPKFVMSRQTLKATPELVRTELSKVQKNRNFKLETKWMKESLGNLAFPE